jgi:hypothetical protein
MPKAQMVALFPTSGAIDEALQIGRLGEIDLLTESALAGENRVIAEPRRVGKSSLLRAVRQRIHSKHADVATVLAVDLRDGIASSADLASDLLAQARAQGAGGRRGLTKRLFERVRKAANMAPEDLADLAEGLDPDEVAALEGLVALARRGTTSLHEVFGLLDEDARDRDRPVVVLVDEIQEVGRWSDGAAVLREIAVAAKRGGARISFILTGSEVSAIEALFEPEGSPLIGVARRLLLPTIDDQVWTDGLIDRYRACGLEITREQVRTILTVSGGHPLKTMLICRASLDWLLPGTDALADVSIQQAIKDARSNPDWSRL